MLSALPDLAMPDQLRYEVRRVQDDRPRVMARFRLLTDATRFVEARRDQGPWEIVMPDGRRLGETETVVLDPKKARAKPQHDTVPELRVPHEAMQASSS